MLLNWRSRFGATPRSVVGIEACDEGLAVVHVAMAPSGPLLRHCEFFATTSGESRSAVLTKWVSTQSLRRFSCNWVICPGQYNLLLLEAPRVAPEEMREAVRWQIKDLVSFPVDQAILDIFELPEDGSRGRRMIYAVAAEREHIKTVVEESREAGLKLKAIDIGELVLRNLAERLPAEERGLALVRVQKGRGSLALIRGGHLYLSRQFELHYQGGEHEPLPEEQLVLEIQRSLDYYERQMAQEAPARILVCGYNVTSEKITDTLRNSLSTPLDYLRLDALVPGGEGIDEALLQRCVGALGAALRVEKD